MKGGKRQPGRRKGRQPKWWLFNKGVASIRDRVEVLKWKGLGLRCRGPEQVRDGKGILLSLFSSSKDGSGRLGCRMPRTAYLQVLIQKRFRSKVGDDGFR